MGRITADQSQQIVAALMTNAAWSAIDFDALNLQNTVIRDAKTAGAHFTAFLQAGARMPTVATSLAAPKRIRAPKGARIHILRGVKTLLDGEWQAAINAGAPDTPASYAIRKVGNLYLPTGTGELVEDMILLNYPNGDGSMEKALAWARAKSLTADDPRRVFAAAQQYPELPRILGCDRMYLVAPVECSFEGDRHAACVWCVGSERKADLLWVGSFGSAYVWFAFRK